MVKKLQMVQENKRNMRIGVFDSGLGGLIVTKAIRKLMPEYDYVYFGDTKRVPYGNKSHESVYEFTREAVDYLFRKEGCGLVIVACNTASATALRLIQHEYLPARNATHSVAGGPKNFKDRNVLGVLIPACEIASKYNKVGVLATLATVSSKTFPIEIKKLNKKTKVYQNPAPMLVPLIESGELSLVKPFLTKYLKSITNKKLDALVLGCTHYPILKNTIKKLLPKNVKIISQDEIVPKKLKDYLWRHPEISRHLSKGASIKILVTDKTEHMKTLVKKWFGDTPIKLI